jgi:hypothetical protein
VSLKVWVDCEGLQTAVKMQLDLIKAYLSEASISLLTAPAPHSCLKMPITRDNKGSFTDSNSAHSISVGSTPRSARSARFADENGGSGHLEIGPIGSAPNSPSKESGEDRKARMDSQRTISFSLVESVPSTPGKEGREGKSARKEKESERNLSVPQNQPVEEGVVLNFDEYVKEWVSRITDLHHAVNTQERERYTTALRMGEREARLVLRRLKASEYREDKAHRELKRLSQLEATFFLNNATKGEGARTRGDSAEGEGARTRGDSAEEEGARTRGDSAESQRHSSDGVSGFLGGIGLESSSSRLGPMGAVLPGGSSLFESKSLSLSSMYEQSQLEWGGSQMIDGLTQKGKEDGRTTLKMISQLRDDLQQMRLLSYEPVLIRLKQLGGDIKDLKGMECSLRLMSMAVKKQIVTLQNNLSISLGTSSPRGDVENDGNVKYMSDLDRRAVKHRIACLQSQLDGLDKRATRY